MTWGHIRYGRAASGLFKPCCCGNTVMVTAPLLPQRVSPVVTPDVQGFNVCVCVCQRTRVSVNVVEPSNRNAEWIPLLLFTIHTEFTCCCFFACVFVSKRTRGCACTEKMFSNSMRCYPSYCLNIPPPASSTRPQTVSLWCLCVHFLCVLATYTRTVMVHFL